MQQMNERKQRLNLSKKAYFVKSKPTNEIMLSIQSI